MTSAHLFLGSLPNFHICHNFPRNWTQAEIGADPRWTMGASTKFPVLPFQRTFHPQLAGVFMRAGCWGIQGRKRWMKNLPNWRSLPGRCHHQTPEKPPSPHKKLPIFFSPTTKGLHHSCSVVSSSSLAEAETRRNWPTLATHRPQMGGWCDSSRVCPDPIFYRRVPGANLANKSWPPLEAWRFTLA